MISTPYPTKGTARAGAKEYAQATGVKKLNLLLDVPGKQFYYSDDTAPAESQMIVFARLEQHGGKWREKAPRRTA